MFDAAYPAFSWQDLVEMAAPSGRACTIPITARCCRVQNGFNAAPHAACRFGFGGPKRLQHRQNDVGIDVLNGQRARNGVDVGFQSAVPLSAMLAVTPAG